jgi:5-methylcytosine-specific restriction protein B
MRKNSSKGAEKDYFIGTEKSNYSAFTLWNIPVSYPGSSGELLSFILRVYNKRFYVKFEFNTSKQDKNEGNLLLGNLLKEKFNNSDWNYWETTSDKKQLYFSIELNKEGYDTFEDYKKALNEHFEIVIPIIDQSIAITKQKFNAYVAHRFTQEEFYSMKKKLNTRINVMEEQEKFDFKEFINRVKTNDLAQQFSFKETKANYVWISDKINIKGDDKAHYEILYKSEGINVEIHFEDKDNLKISKLLETNLKIPNQIIWFPWNKAKSLKFNSRLKPDDPETLSKVLERLIYLKDNLSESIGKVLYNKINQPLNQILYGPPGTGKTYSTIEIINDIIYPNNQLSRVEKKLNFDKLLNDKRVYFTTFHQSMSYEEFIEGIKPITVKDQVQYKITDGIFKSICEQCLDEIKELKNQSAPMSEANLTFKEKFEEFVLAIQKGIIEIKTRSGIEVSLSKVSPAGNIRLITGTDTKDYIISANRLEKLYTAFPNPSLIVNIHEEIRNVIGGSHSSLYYAALEAFVKFDEEFQKSVHIEGKELELKDIKLTEEEIQSLPPYFLVIDEINRGNVSSIFGELITLLEEDKRFGKENQLFIKLPYSKEDFIVPPNLYIIGTMNTADRSVEALDTALRRRFSFVEMLPDPSKLVVENDKPLFIGDINLQDLLYTINKRIEFLVDRDHTIGHAFLIRVDSIPALKATFKNKIIPLLQEYFYGNYYKIELVLGSGFFSKKAKSHVTFALENPEVDTEGFNYDFINLDSIKDVEFIQLLNAMKIEELPKTV